MAFRVIGNLRLWPRLRRNRRGQDVDEISPLLVEELIRYRALVNLKEA
ncbi:MAG: hypothetical protein QXW94_06230 [Desulfurococcaceae archaeon]